MGLENITSVGRNISFDFNKSLTSLVGFENITNVNGNIVVYYNNSLESLFGLENITSIRGNLRIESNGSCGKVSPRTRLLEGEFRRILVPPSA